MKPTHVEKRSKMNIIKTKSKNHMQDQIGFQSISLVKNDKTTNMKFEKMSKMKFEKMHNHTYTAP